MLSPTPPMVVVEYRWGYCPAHHRVKHFPDTYSYPIWFGDFTERREG